MDLLQKMVNGTPQFVRCIKPNECKKPNNFDEKKVLKQLRYAGIFETVRIRQNGFSHRILFADFLKKYCFLAFKFNERVVTNRAFCQQLIDRLKIKGYAIGKSKVFLKFYHMEYLSKLYRERLKKIIIVQSVIRRFLARKYVLKLKTSLAFKKPQPKIQNIWMKHQNVINVEKPPSIPSIVLNDKSR
jgi:myosin-3